jgi:hypothetical protein
MSRYGTVDQLIQRIELSAEPDADRVTMLEELLDAISRKIDNFCGVPDNWFIAEDPESIKYFLADGKPWLRIPECIEVTAVAVKDTYTDTTYTSWDSPSSAYAGDGDWLPASGTYEYPLYGRLPYTLLIVDPNGDFSVFTNGVKLPTVQVTAKWGYSASVPADIREATLAQTTVLYKRFQGSMSASLASSDLGIISMRIRQSALSRDVQELLIDSGWVRPLYGQIH